MQAFDLVIRGGFVVDGTGCPGTYADVGIVGDQILEIGDLAACEATRVIDATGKTVAPGFVTNHAHYDAALFWHPYGLDAGHNGVTTVVNANCGFGFAPVRASDQERVMGMMETTEQIPVPHQRAGMPWDWETFPEFIERTRSLAKGINVSTFLPLNPVLVYVMGIEGAKTRQPSDSELTEIHRIINEAMDAGAIGISLSVLGPVGNTHVDVDGTPMPTDLLDDASVLKICQAVINRGEGVIQLLRRIIPFGDRDLCRRVAVEARGTGVRVIHNVFLTHDMLPEMVDDDLAWLDATRAEGLDITAGALINRAWVEAGIRELDAASGQLPAVRELVGCSSDDELKSLLRDESFVQRFESQYQEVSEGNPSAALEPQTIIGVGAEPSLQDYLGRTLGDVASGRGSSAVRVLVEFALRSNLELQLKSLPVSSTQPEQALKLMNHPAVVPGGSDGGAHTKAFGMGHYGTDLLIWLVREEQRRSLEDMHFQLSLKNARSVNIRDRGALLPGFKADLLVYDLKNLHLDTTCYERIHDMPEGDWRRQARAGGYDFVVVNGQITHENDIPTGATPGQFVQVTRA